MATQVSLNDLSNWLASQPENTVDTPYAIEVIDFTTGLPTFSQALYDNRTKYVDLSETQVPLSTTLSWWLSGQPSIVEPPKLPSGLETMNGIFKNCTALKHGVTDIPEGVTDMSQAYLGCTSLLSATIPEGITDVDRTFENCVSLISAPVIPEGVTSVYGTFKGCAITTAPKLPSTVTDMSQVFYDCTLLTSVPPLPDGVLFTQDSFRNCSSLQEKPILPSSVTLSTDCFTGVTTNDWKGTESQAESFVATFFTQTADSEIQVYNSDRITYEYSIYNVDISNLSTHLAGLDANTVSTAYKIYIRGLTPSNKSDIKMALSANPTKFVDLGYTIIPDNTYCGYLFDIGARIPGCVSLVVAPVLPSVNTESTWLELTFYGCVNLREAPEIPSIYTRMDHTFYACYQLQQVPILPTNLVYARGAFGWCHSLTSTGNLNISTLKTCETMFFGCKELTTVQNLPPNLKNMKQMFSECEKIETISSIPSSVTNGVAAFYDCTSLTKIDEFNIPLNTLKNNSDFRDMFANCPNLETIGYNPGESDQWHAFRLKFGASSVEGKVFDMNGVGTAIASTSITKDTINMPVLTDELWFPDSNTSDADIETLIGKVIQNRYTYWKKEAIDPTAKSLVLYADDPNNVVSNIIPPAPVDVVQDDNMAPVTSNAVAQAIATSNFITATNVRIGTAQAKITLNQLMTWLITTKGYIPSGTDCSRSIGIPWDYNGNDILQLSANGMNYELQLAGCLIEFLGNATNYNTGRFRLRIHSSPTTSFTPTSGYTAFPTSRIAEYTCNGSGYTPTWKVVGTDEKYANSFWGLTDPSGADSVWLRTTSNGIIPYQGGNAGSGHCSIGTSTWYFANVFTDYVNGYVPMLRQDQYNPGSTSSNARNYIRFTNGLKIQWGIVYKGSNLSHGTGWETTVTMSLAFTSYNYSLTFGSVNNNQTSYPSGEEIYAIRNSDLQSFKVKFWNRNSGDNSISPSIAWIAIGW